MFTRFSNLIFSRNHIVKRVPSRFNTTSNPTANPTANPTTNPTPKPTGQDPGKGKGPITWKSFSVALVGGAGLLVSEIECSFYAISDELIIVSGLHVVRQR